MNRLSITARNVFGNGYAARNVIIGLCTIIVAYLVLFPLFVLVNESISVVPTGGERVYSLSGFTEMLGHWRTYRILANSMIYAAGSSLVALLIGGSLVWLVQRTDIPGKKFVMLFALFPLFMPPVLSAIGWVLLLDSNVGLMNVLTEAIGLGAIFNANSMAGMIWVGGVLEVPLVFLWLWPAFAAMNPALEEAAAICGARSIKVIMTILLPIMLPAFGAVLLINFILSIEDVMVPIVLGLPAGISVLASEIYIAHIRVPTDTHTASVYSVLLLVITMALAFYYLRLTSNTDRYVTVRGRGFSQRTLELGKARIPVFILVSLVLGVIVGLPMFILGWTSLMPFLQVPSIEGLSLITFNHYWTLLEDPAALRGIFNTLIVGVSAAFVVMSLAVVIGWLQVRTRTWFSRSVDLLAFTPIAVPGLVIGLSLSILYLNVPLEIYGTLLIIWIAFVTRFLPYGVRLTYSGFSQIHRELEEAALISKAGWFRTIRTISLPLLGPTLLVGFVYTILRGFREISASLLLSSYGNEPYSVVAYHMWDGGEVGKASAYGVVALCCMVLLVVVGQWIAGRKVIGPDS